MAIGKLGVRGASVNIKKTSFELLVELLSQLNASHHLESNIYGRHVSSLVYQLTLESLSHIKAMASTSSPAVSLSRLDFPLSPHQKNMKINPFSLTFSKQNRHQVNKLRRISESSGLKSNEFVLFSSLNGQIGESSLPTQEATSNNNAPQVQVQSSIWKWRGYSIRYQHAGNNGPALVLIHGFGANSDHWRKNLPVLAKSHKVYSIDLIGYGYSDKPNPRQFGETSFYTFETWGTQINEFCIEVVKGQAFFICNSIGGLVGLQAAVMEPELCKGIMLLNISLRMLHIKKQPWYARPLIKSFQNLLRNTDIGKYFFKTVATPDSVKNILCQCYYDSSQVTQELVEKILLPGLEAGAVDVFLEFICYSDGPLPEELLPQVKCPVLIGWGDKDPWEPIDLGRAYGKFDSVEEFVVLPNVGHCPQDEAPDLVNPLVESFVARHAAFSPSISTTS